jgi:hypothetical protein
LVLAAHTTPRAFMLVCLELSPVVKDSNRPTCLPVKESNRPTYLHLNLRFNLVGYALLANGLLALLEKAAQFTHPLETAKLIKGSGQSCCYTGLFQNSMCTVFPCSPNIDRQESQQDSCYARKRDLLANEQGDGPASCNGLRWWAGSWARMGVGRVRVWDGGWARTGIGVGEGGWQEAEGGGAERSWEPFFGICALNLATCERNKGWRGGVVRKRPPHPNENRCSSEKMQVLES